MSQNEIVHLWDLPQDKVYIRFKPDFRDHFYGCLLNEFGSWKTISEELSLP